MLYEREGVGEKKEFFDNLLVNVLNFVVRLKIHLITLINPPSYKSSIHNALLSTNIPFSLISNTQCIYS